LTLEEVASHVHLSSFYFSKLFKKETGKNFVRYVNDEKMELAKEMLISTPLPIDVISSDLGFSHTSYFCKIFKKKFATTPKSYRKSFSLKAN
jgi:AraC-like DNA-binding protein